MHTTSMAGERWGQNHLQEFQILTGEGGSTTLKVSTNDMGNGVVSVRANELRLALGSYSGDPNALLILDSRQPPVLDSKDQEPRTYLRGRLDIVLKPLVVIEGVETRLRDKEHELLDVLTSYPNHYIEFDKLISAVWGVGYLMSSEKAKNNLRRHIQLIRSKLELIGDLDPSTIIRSLRGYGYGFFDQIGSSDEP